MGLRARRRGAADPLARTRRQRRTGVSLMVTSLVAGGVLSALSPAAIAQEEPQAPEDTQPVEFEKTAYWTYPASNGAPPTLTNEFPPGVVCLVLPGVNPDLGCPEELKPVGEQVVGAIGGVQENEPTPPRGAVPPDTLPVGINAGVKRYESAVKFPTPEAGGEQFDQYVLVMNQTDPTYQSDSPAFRQFVLATLTCARTNDDGSRCEQDQFEKLQDTPPAERGAPGVEVCPFTEPFEEGESQAPPKNDEGQFSQPVDCLFGSNGVQLEDGTWLFDLTFAVQAWQSGDIPNEGVLLRPTGASNLAYGDPDPTYYSQATFTKTAAAASDTSPAPEPVETFDDSGSTDNGTQSSGGFSSGSGTSSGGSGFTSAPSGGVSNEVFSPPADAGPAPVAQDPAPQVADGGQAGQGQTLDSVPVAGVTDEGTGSAWWMWLLAPIFGAGAWVTAQSLTAPVALGTADRAGAMTRLIEQNSAASSSSSSPMTQV